MSPVDRKSVQKGRGAASNPAGRFAVTHAEADDDGWGILEEPLPPLATTVQPDVSRTIIARNQSPDIPFTQSINPYRGCAHGCPYCFARPSHAYLDLSPGLDFETRLFYKPDAAKLLAQELAAPGYECSAVALGTNTDPYQPIEREYGVTRAILETLSACNHPATIVTKGAALIARDVDLLASMAERNLIAVSISITTLDKELKRTLEPRAAGAGAKTAGYVMLRLPFEVNAPFQEWLRAHAPLKAEHVLARVRELRGGRENDPRFGSRMRGEGIYAELFRKRFEVACRRCGLDREHVELDTSRFRPPGGAHEQLALL